MWRELRRWQGLVLITIPLVATIWLAATGQLVLYIHPRYVIFTVAMAIIGLVLVLASVARARETDRHEREHERDAELVETHAHDGHGHDHGQHTRTHGSPAHGSHARGSHVHESPAHGEHSATLARSRTGLIVSSIATTITVATALSLLVLPPATLSAATATQRDISGSRLTTDAATVDSAEAADASAFAEFSVLDWSSLLRQTGDPAFYADKPANVVGFITEDPDDPDNMFFVSRFVITCCAVDAQPVGVPVYLEDWKDEYQVDEWVEVGGGFEPNPSADSSQPVALVPEQVTVTEQPTDPYLF